MKSSYRGKIGRHSGEQPACFGYFLVFSGVDEQGILRACKRNGRGLYADTTVKRKVDTTYGTGMIC